MGLTKHAEFRVLAARIAPEGGGPLMRTAHRHEFEYEPKPGFLYVRSRAISSRTNDNFDNFPAEEIKQAYRTFVGKPVFVNHHNDNHRRARGVIKDAVLHEDVNPDGSQDTWVEVLMEVDAVRFPKLAQAILAGHIDRTSMGTDVAYSVCSVCNNKASSPVDYCKHIPKMKGQKIWRTTASGQKEGVLVYEKCYGLGFFENSLLVEEPADPTAYFLGVDARGVEGMAKAASKTAATYRYDIRLSCEDPVTYVGSQPGQVEVGKDWTCEAHGEQKVVEVSGPGTTQKGLGFDFNGSRKEARRTAADEKVLAPAEVDTLREENCPVCGEATAFDGDKCQVCGFVSPPSEFGDPDTEQAGITDLRQQQDDTNDKGGDLACDNCGATFASEGHGKTALVLDPEKGSEASDDAASTQAKAGDSCPTCGEGTLQPSATAPDAGAAADADGFAPAGSGAEEAASAPGEVEPQDDADDEDESDESDDEDGEDGDKPDFLKKKDKKKPTAARRGSTDGEGADVAMRPALAALAAQQKQIEALRQENKSLRSAVAFIAKVAGIESHPQITAGLKTVAVDENPAFGGGWDNMAAETEKAPVVTTQEAATPTAKDDVENVGSTPLTDVTPDAQTSLADTGVVLDVTEPTQDDVTAQVAGTDTLGQGERGNPDTNKTETEIRVGDPVDNSAAFRDGGFLGSKSEARTIASLRLARLQIQAGIAGGDDLDLSQVIAASERSDESIQTEIATLSKVVTATRQPQRVARNLVPQGASQAQRMVPSMATTATAASQGESVGTVSGEEMLFE